MFDPNFLMWQIALSALGVSFILWGAAIMRISTGRKLLPCERREPVPWGFIDLVLLVVIYLLAAVSAARVIAELGLKSPLSEQATSNDRIAWLTIQIAIPTLGTLLVLAIITIRNRANLSDLGIRPGEVVGDLLLGVVAFVMLAPPVFLIQALVTTLYTYEHPLIELVKSDPRLLLVSGISAVLIAPFSEEIQFRLLLQGWLEKCAVWRGNGAALLMGGRLKLTEDEQKTASNHEAIHDDDANHDADSDSPPLPDEYASNPYAPPQTDTRKDAAAEESGEPSKSDQLAPRPHWWPILVSAFIFAAMHAHAWPSPVPLFVLALGLGFLYRQTHRLLPSIMVHLLLNATTMLLLYLSIHFPLKE